LAGCAEYAKPMPKRTLAHQPPPVVAYKKPVPLTTYSITPLAAPTPAIEPAPALNSTPVLSPTPALDPAPALAPAPAPAPAPALDPTPIMAPTPVIEMSVADQLKAAWKHICGLRNVEHVEKGRVNETEAQKHFIDEKCADVRRDSHMQ
jgi:hypothetical protein